MHKVIFTAVAALVLAAIANKTGHRNPSHLDRMVRSLPAPVKTQMKSIKLDNKIPTRDINRFLGKASKRLSKEVASNRKDARKALKALSKSMYAQQKSASKYLRTI